MEKNSGSKRNRKISVASFSAATVAGSIAMGVAKESPWIPIVFLSLLLFFFIFGLVILRKKNDIKKPWIELAIWVIIILSLLVITICIMIKQNKEDFTGTIQGETPYETPMSSSTPDATSLASSPSPTFFSTPEMAVEGRLNMMIYEWCASIIPIDTSKTDLYSYIGVQASSICPTVNLRDPITNDILYKITDGVTASTFSFDKIASGKYRLEIITTDYFPYYEEVFLDPNDINSGDDTWQIKSFLKPYGYEKVDFTIDVQNSEGDRSINREYDFGLSTFRMRIQSDSAGNIPLRFEARDEFMYYITDISTNEVGIVKPSYNGEAVKCTLNANVIEKNRLNILFREWFFDCNIDGGTISFDRVIPDIYPTIALSNDSGQKISGYWSLDGYSINDLDDGKYSLNITLEGYKTYKYSFSIRGDVYSGLVGPKNATQKQWIEIIPMEKENQKTYDFTVRVVDEAGLPIRNAEFVVGAHQSSATLKTNNDGVLQGKFRGLGDEYSIALSTEETKYNPEVDMKYTKFIVDRDGEIIVNIPTKQ